MPTIKGFSTKKEGWQDQVLEEVSKQGGSINLPFSATGLKVGNDPFENVDKKVVKDTEGNSLKYKKV